MPLKPAVPRPTAAEVIALLGLQHLPVEGGYYRETYRAALQIPPEALPAGYDGARRALTAIYYLLTPDTFSALHRLPSDEQFHFYAGDPVEMLQLHPDGRGEVLRIGVNFAAGERPQVGVSGGTWQGSRIAAGGEWALLGTTVSPGFEFADYQAGHRAALLRQYPQHAELIQALTRAAGSV